MSFPSLAVVGLLGFFLCSANAAAQNAPSTPAVMASDSEYVPGELVVRIKGHYQGEQSGRVFNHLHGRVHRVKSMAALNIHHLQITDGTAETDMIDELNSNPDVVYAEPNYLLHLVDAPSLMPAQNQAQGSGSGDVTIEGSVATYTQDSANVQVSAAWSVIGASAATPIVAVVDTGIDYTHYVFTDTSAVWQNSKEIPSNGIDDDGNGYIDDTQGWNFAYNTNNVMDDNGHGTHVSGIVIGLGQNVLGSASSLTTSKIQVMALKFMDSTGSGTTANAVAAIYYATSMGARVINNSWGGTGYSQSLHDALSMAYGNGIFISTAAGNYSTSDDSSPLYPASLPIPGQMTVAATDNNDVLASFSSYGPSTVQVAAPGVNVLSTYPGNAFAYMSGTSMATPFVSGLAALVIRASPQLTGYQVKQILLTTANPINDLSGYVSSGSRVNALSAVETGNTSTAVVASQPGYAAVPPPGTNTGTTTTQSTGCGLVSGSAGAFWAGRGGGNSGLGSPSVSLLFVFLALPFLVWFSIRRYWEKHVQRRRHDRFVIDSEVRVRVEGREFCGRLNTISMGGASFSAEELLDKGGTVKMSIQGPDGGEPIEVVGRIVWREENKSYGVQFGPATDNSLIEQIRKWTEALMKAS